MTEDLTTITKFTIQDVMCIQHVELNLGRLPAGKGRLYEFFAGNEQGKSSLRDACASAFEPGKNPDLIREGASKAIVVVDLSDGHQLIRTHEPDQSTYDIIGASGVSVSAPATFVKKLTRGFSFDPLKFDNAEPKKQLEYLLSISSVEFTSAEISEAVGAAVAPLLEMPGSAPLPLSSLNPRDMHFGKFVKQVTELRAATGRRRDEKTSMIEGLRKTIDAQIGTEHNDTTRDLAKELSALQTERDTLAANLQADLLDVTDQARDRRENPAEKKEPTLVLTEAVAVAGNQLMEAIRHLSIKERKSAAQKVLRAIELQIDTEERQRIEAITAAEQRAIETVKSQGAEAREQNAVALAQTQAAMQAQAGIKANRDLKASIELAVAGIVAEYDAIDRAVKALDALRKSKLEKSFVKGLELREDERIYINGVVWTKLNSATRFEKSLEICAQGIGELGFVVCDGGERLDALSRERFKKGVEKSGLQVVLFSVSTPEQLDKYGPAIHTIPPGIISNMHLIRRA